MKLDYFKKHIYTHINVFQNLSSQKIKILLNLFVISKIKMFLFFFLNKNESFASIFFNE